MTGTNQINNFFKFKTFEQSEQLASSWKPLLKRLLIMLPKNLLKTSCVRPEKVVNLQKTDEIEAFINKNQSIFVLKPLFQTVI